MAGRLFEPEASRAVLIGVSQYAKLPNLRPVKASLAELRSALTDARICRLPAKHCTVVPDPTDGNAVGRALAKAAAEATDMLLVYYAGHGLGGLRRRQLFLALKDTDPDRPAFHSLPYDVLRDEVLDSSASSRVVILDCCFSGRAAAPVMATNGAAILEQLDIAGAYVLTASPANEAAIVGRRITEFTGELVGALRNGIPGAPALLTLDALYAHLRWRLISRNLPEPRRLHTDAAGLLALAANPLHGPLVRHRQASRPAAPAQLTDQGVPADLAVAAAAFRAATLGMARRSTTLVDRLIGHLDLLERAEEDPERLVGLFQIDHLATRMRRNNENAAILAGADPSLVLDAPAALMDVLRAAQAEIEHYARIEFRYVDHDVVIARHAAGDLVRMAAELFDNAAVFSDSDTVVVVDAYPSRDGVLLQVEDRGTGMSPEQYVEHNQRLANPPTPEAPIKEPMLREMGLFLVSVLAARHGIKVELRPAPERGTVVEVLLPLTTMVNDTSNNANTCWDASAHQ